MNKYVGTCTHSDSYYILKTLHHRVSAVFVSAFHCCFEGMLAPIAVQRVSSLFFNRSSWIGSQLMGWSSRGLVACLLCVAWIRDDDVRQKKQSHV